MDLGTVFFSMHEAIARADSASDAWMSIIRLADAAGARVADEVRTVDIEADTASVGTQLRSITLQRPPKGMDFLYFGLYDAYDKATGGTLPGFCLAGGRGEHPEEAVYETPLPYRLRAWRPGESGSHGRRAEIGAPPAARLARGPSPATGHRDGGVTWT